MIFVLYSDSFVFLVSVLRERFVLYAGSVDPLLQHDTEMLCV